MEYQIRHPKNNAEICNVFGILEVCFPKIDNAYFIKRFLGDPHYNKRNSYLLIKNNSIISHAQLFKKKIYCYGKQLPIVGLGAICTLPEYRNRGYSKALLKKAIQDIRNTSAPLMLLFTRVPQLYEGLKFSRTTRKYHLLKKRKVKSEKLPGLKGIKIRRFNFDRDILSVMDIYEKYFKCHFGPSVREFKDWQSQLSYFNEDKRLFLVLEDKQGVKAYIRCKRSSLEKQKLIEIVELASKNQDNSSLIYLLNYIFKSTDAYCLGIDSRLIKEDLSKFFDVNVKDNALLMYRFIKKHKTINASNMKEITFLESDAF